MISAGETEILRDAFCGSLPRGSGVRWSTRGLPAAAEIGVAPARCYFLFMNHKLVVKVAIVMVVVFGLIVIAYPRLFGPSGTTPAEAPPSPPVMPTPAQ